MKNTTALIVMNPENVNALTNRELRSNVKQMIKAMASMNKNTWQYAIAVHNIIVNDLHKDDFQTIDNFAKAMDTTKGNLSKYVNAVSVLTALEQYGYTVENISCGSAYLLSTLKEDFTAFMEKYVKVDFSKMTKSQLEDLIKKFKEKDVVADEEAETEAEAEAEAETEAEETKGTELEAYIVENNLVFTYRKKEYIVPLKDLKGYIQE